MPKVNCCVPYCVSTTRKTPRLKFYHLPKASDRKTRWAREIRNANLKINSKWTSVCSLHFKGGVKTYDVKDPSIFPWTEDWPRVIESYNKTIIAQKNIIDEHCYCENRFQVAKLLPLFIPTLPSKEHVFDKVPRPNKKCRDVITASESSPFSIEYHSTYPNSDSDVDEDTSGNQDVDCAKILLELHNTRSSSCEDSA